MIHTGDCVEVMAQMEPESVDAIVTDPPYGLEFMGKEWDSLFRTYDRGSGRPDAPTIKARGGEWQPGSNYGGRAKQPRCMRCGKLIGRGTGVCRCPEPIRNERRDEAGYQMQYWHGRWAEAAYRVAKPSAYLLAFGGTRTFHRLACALEDAGWIIRDTLVWGYASGFPKSKASLKPAWEPIVMARKPGPLRDLAIDACRIPMSAQDAETIEKAGGFMQAGWQGPDTGIYNKSGDVTVGATVQGGRWPANIVLTHPIFDGGWEGVVGGGESAVKGQYRDTETVEERPSPWFGSISGQTHGYRNDNTYANDSGTYSRFFLIPKADRADREPVLGGLPEVGNVKWQPFRGRCTTCGHWQDPGETACPCGGVFEHETNRMVKPRANVHPTVKPTDLMRHLVRLVTPAGGVVLDPFLGSGTTAIAAEMEGFGWIGIEREAEYVAIAEARLNGVQKGLGLSA